MAQQKLSFIVDLVNRTEAGFKQIYSNLEETEKRMENTTRFMREVGLVGTAAFGAMGLATKRFLSDAAELEQQGIAFETMLGSAEAAKAMLEDLSDFAQKTPFELQGIRSTAKQLLAMSVPAKDMIPTMKALGDVSAGLGVDLNRLAYNYGQVKTQTKLTGVELKDFMRAGVPLVGVLAEMLNKSEAEIQEMVSAGEIGFPIVEEAFQKMTSEGGKFQDLMFKQSASLSGQISNLQDNITKLSEEIGTALLPVAKEITDRLIVIAEKISEWASKNPELAATVVKITLAVTGLMAVMLPLSFVLPRLIVSFGLMSSAVKGTIALMPKLIALLTMNITIVDRSVKAIFTWSTYTNLASKASKGFAAAQVAVSGAVKAATASLLTASGALRVFKIVLASTGVGAIIVLIGIMVSKFMELSDTVGGVGNAIKLFWAEFKVNTLKGIEAFLEGIAKVLNALPGVDNALGDSIETIGWLREAAEADSAEIAANIASVGTASDNVADQMNLDIQSMMAGLDNLTSGTEETAKAAEEHFKSIVDTVKDVRDEIRDVYKDINDATAEFQKNLGLEQTSYEENVVNKVADATEEKKRLEEDLKRAKKENNEEDVKDLKEKIKAQEDILKTYKKLNLDLDEEVSERRRYLRMNELEQITYDHKKKLEMMKQEFLADQVERLKRLVSLHTEHAQIMNLVDLETQSKIESEIAKTRSVREQLALQKQSVATWTAEAGILYANFVTTTNQTLSKLKLPIGKLSVSGLSISGTRANGGPVSAGKTYLVGEKGPELFTPENSGRILANASGSNITIVFSGNHFTNEDFAREVERKIETQMKRQLRFSLA